MHVGNDRRVTFGVARLLAGVAGLAVLAVAFAALAGSARAEDPEPDVELRVWQSVAEPPRLWVSARPDDDASWRTSELDLAIIEGGGWRAGDLTVRARNGGIDLRVWQDPSALATLHLSARPAGASWAEYGTQPLTLDQTSKNGRYTYADLTIALAADDAEPPAPPDEPPPADAPPALCIPEGLATETIEGRVWRSVAEPDRYWVTTRADANSRWVRQARTIGAAGEDGWRTLGVIADAGEADFELRVWRGGDGAHHLSARVAGATWLEYGTRPLALPTTSKNGRYTYGDIEITLTPPEAEPPLPGEEAATWACPEAAATPTPTPAAVAGGVPIGGGTPSLPGQQPDPNNAPPKAHAGPDQIVSPGDTVTLDGSKSFDPELESPGLSYSWVRRAGAAGGTYDGNTSIRPASEVRPSFTMPTDATPGETLIFTLTVTDPSGAKSTNADTVTITTNTPPVADAGTDQTSAAGATVTLDGSGSSDANNDTLSHSWSQDTTTTDPGYYTTEITLTGGTSATPSFEVPSAAMGLKIKFTLTAADGNGGTGTDDVEVTVTANQPPATPSPSATPASGKPGTAVSLTAAAVTDPDAGHTVTYKWTKDDSSTYAGSITITGSTTLSAGFTVPSDATKGQTIVLRLTASDDQTPSAKSHGTVTFTADAELTTSNLTARGVTLNLAGWSGNAWWYKSATTGKTTCTSAGTGAAADVTGLSPGTAYVFTAYRNSTCTTALDAAPLFTTPAELTVTDVTATGATLNLAGHTAQWWYKATTGPDSTCQGPVAANTATEALTGLSPGTSYIYSAYDATGCASADLLAIAPAFTTGVSLAASNVTATGATLTIAGHTAQWWYKANAAPDNTCKGPVAANTATEALTGLSPGTSYIYSAYSADGCASAKQLATASSFTTPAELTTSNLTARGVTLNLAGRTGAWYYKSATAGQTTCTSAGTSASVNVTGLTPGTDYTFTAYSNSTCATVIIAAPEFTTPVELTAGSTQTATTVTLTIAGHTAQWWYKANTGPSNTCRGPVVAGTNSTYQIGLTPGVSYTYWAYSAIGCDDDDLLATATFTTKSPVLTSSNVTKNSATLSLGNWDGNKDPTWAYKSATAGKTTCTTAPALATQATVTGLTAGTAYIFTAYRDSACTIVLDAAPSFTTTHAPTVTFSNANVTAGNTATLSVTAGHTGSGTISSYTWSVTEKSAGAPDASLTNTATTTATTGLVVPSNAWKASPHHTYTVKVRVTDSAGEWTEARATLTVNNRPPVADARADKAYALYPQRVNLSALSSSDPDYNPNTDPVPNWSYSWAKTGGTYTKPISISYATSGTASFNVPNDASIGDTIIITLTVGDGDGGTDTDSVTINVNAAPQQTNNPPVADAGAAIQYFSMTPVNKDNPTVSLDGSGSSDPDGDTLIYEWKRYGGTCTATITLTNPASAKPTFTWPSGCAISTSVGLRLTVYDRAKNGLSDTEDIQVWRRNGMPTVTITGGTVGLTEYKRSDSTARAFTVAGSVSDDPDGHALTYDWQVRKGETSGAPSGLTLSNGKTKTVSIEIGSGAVPATDYTVYLIVRDSQGSTLTKSASLTITLNSAPGTPTLNHTSLSVNQAQSYELRASATDSDAGQTLSYTWTRPANCPSLSFTSANTATTRLNVAPTAPTTGSCTVKARVTDGYGGESEATLVVNFTP